MAYRKITSWEDTEARVVELIKSGLSVTQACTVAGIYKSTLYRRYKKKKGSIKPLQEKVEDSRRYYEAWIKSEMQQLYTKLKESDQVEALKHLRWLAERKLRNEFYRKQQVDNTTRDTTKIDRKNLKDLYQNLKKKYGKDVGSGKNRKTPRTPITVDEG